ncbi:hypothetical protein RDI58_022268 [Solanum bulbocastanum]|uniref:Uncharacterized protein n=1 Tax=Solanum bulbocastanum TaxID=147425 RepID=A0AAN8Y5H5_SOLBU
MVVFQKDKVTTGMAREPPIGIVRPPNQSQKGRSDQTNKTHQESSSNSTSSSMNLQIKEVMNSASSERELDEVQEIISPSYDGLIREKLITGNDSVS